MRKVTGEIIGKAFEQILEDDVPSKQELLAYKIVGWAVAGVFTVGSTFIISDMEYREYASTLQRARELRIEHRTKEQVRDYFAPWRHPFPDDKFPHVDDELTPPDAWPDFHIARHACGGYTYIGTDSSDPGIYETLVKVARNYAIKRAFEEPIEKGK